MNWKRALASLACAAALVLAMLLPAAGAAGDDVIFLGLNDQVMLPLSASTMPIRVNRTFYVPYTNFDSTRTGIDLGVLVSSQKNQVTVYTRQKMIKYDLSAGTATDREGNEYAHAIMRNGIIYLPVESLCAFFSDVLTCTYTNTAEYGYLIRVTSSAAYIEDDYFFDIAVSSILGPAKNAYLKTLNPSPTPATPSPAPSPNVTPNVTVTPPPGVSPSEGPDKPGRDGVPFYLAFRCNDFDALPALLDELDREGLSALFLLRPDDLAAQGGLIRRMAGSGHALGFLLPGGPAEDAKAVLEDANRLLAQVSHLQTRTVSLESQDPAAAAALSEEGWAIWRGNVDMPEVNSPSALSSALLKAADAQQGAVRATLDTSEQTGRALPRLLADAREEGYVLSLALDTRLG